MDACDVLIVGGGPAGSTCARKLQTAGLDVLLLDKRTFPREKPCAGWITPAVVKTLALDVEEYGRGRVLQEIRNFRTGVMHGAETLISYGRTVSYGIRRCEFDHYLLEQSSARLGTGEGVAVLERSGEGWLVNRRIRARMIVGAGGHFCPVARFLGARAGGEAVVAAQVTECALSSEMEGRCCVPGDTPELFFSRDMKGYGWVFRKGGYLNVGLGRLDTQGLRRHTADFCAFLEQRGDIPPGIAERFRGHAYLVYGPQRGRRRIDDGVLLVGDAAGLAYPQSGEGILPAVESALMAADTILEANGDYRREKLEPYTARLAARFGGEQVSFPLLPVPSGLRRFIGARLLASRWFTRHIVLDRWFLHAGQGGGEAGWGGVEE